MFNNLIESSSHRNEFKRRGSFFLFTTGIYALLFVITGVVSIYAYDAHLESQSTELGLITFVSPETPTETVPQVLRNTIHASSANTNGPARSVRTALVDSVSNPSNVPREVGTIAQGVPPARSDSIIGTTNADPVGPSNTRTTGNGSGGPSPTVNLADPPPPPPPVHVTVPKVIKVSTVLNSQAISLPKPTYPQMAIQIRVQGTVTVQVLIDEKGNVLSAKAISGHPLLVPEAQRAAMQARFSPTVINDQPVKVSGVITYNFVMQ